MRHLRVGDEVRFRWGGQVVGGVVIEDRGPIASHGGQLVRVKLDTADDADAHELEIAAGDILDQKDSASKKRAPVRLATSH